MSKRKGIMLCYPFEEKRLLKWNCPVIVQPKLDGERCRAIIDNGRVTLLSSEENEIISVPHINDAIKTLNLKTGELDGELYSHGLSWNEIHSRVGRTKIIHPEHKIIDYHIFDIVSPPNVPQHQRVRAMNRLNTLCTNPNIKFVQSEIASDIESVMRNYDKFLEQNYEGIIVRHLNASYIRRRSIYLMKFKPKKDDFYEIVGYNEELSIDKVPKNRLGSLICKGNDGTEFSVGSGLNDELRETYWKSREQLIGKLCHVGYQHITSSNKVPRFPVFIEVLDNEPKYVGLI